MSIQTKGVKAKTVAIVGGGCAGWSLAARVDQLYANRVTLYLKEKTLPSHNWGFWQMPWLSAALSKKRAKWNSWQIGVTIGSIGANKDFIPQPPRQRS